MDNGASGVLGVLAQRQRSVTEDQRSVLANVTTQLLKMAESYAQGLDPRVRNVQKQIVKVENQTQNICNTNTM